jgi:chitodextrinase
MNQALVLSMLVTGLILSEGSISAGSHYGNRYDQPGNDKSVSQSASRLPLDGDGWTVITPSPDSKIIYVSSSGGKDSNDGLSPDAPVATIEQASSLVRNGYPDHILLKCGDVWENPNVYRFHSGRSATEPMVISYYGDSIERPLLLINDLFLNIDGDPISNVAFIGLEFYAWKHDPTTPEFSNKKGVAVFRFVGAGTENILIEDCVARYASLGAFHAYVEGTRNINNKLRRNVVLHAWADSTWFDETDQNRIQGFYSSEADSLLIEDCLFDHNGYDEDVEGAGPNMFNHNIYLQYDCSATTVIRNNIIARGAAHGVQLRGGGICSNNVFIRNSVNLNIGGVSAPLDGAGAYSYARENVFYEGKLMDSTNYAYPRTAANVAITILIPSTIENNILVHSLNEASVGIGEYDQEYGLGGSVTEINNIEYRWTDWDQVPDPSWFDPDRRLSHYHQNLGKESSTIAFLEEAAKRPLHTLWPEYSAEAVIQFFRDGFSTDFTDVVPPHAPDTIYSYNISDVSARLAWSYGIDDQRTIAYNVYLDNERYNDEPVKTLGHKISGLSPETGYTVSVKSIDAGGNESPDSIIVRFTTLSEDTEAPSVPRNLALTGRTSESLSLAWDPSTDNYSINGYKIYLDGTAIPDLLPSDTTVTVSGLVQSSRYTFKITAIDNKGNESGFSNEVTTRTVDIEKPGSPQNVHITAATDSTISLAWDAATDNVGVVVYYVYVGGALFDSTATTGIILTGLSAGEKYSINIGALDAEGNKSRNSPPLVVQNLSAGKYPAESEILIYPLPAGQELYITGNSTLYSIDIFDLYGRKRMDFPAEKKISIILNVADLPEGIYLLRLNQEGMPAFRKIIIEH